MKVTPSYLVDFMIDPPRIHFLHSSPIPETRPVRARNLLAELSLTFLSLPLSISCTCLSRECLPAVSNLTNRNRRYQLKDTPGLYLRQYIAGKSGRKLKRERLHTFFFIACVCQDIFCKFAGFKCLECLEWYFYYF